MKINIITTIDIDVKSDKYITQEEINKAYKIFHKIVEISYRNKDLTDFVFINADTNREIEDEVETQ